MKTAKKRLLLLDGIRGFAIINMVAYHFLYDVFVVYQIDTKWYAHPMVRFWQQMICWTFILVSGCTWSMGKQKFKRGILLNLWGMVITCVTSVFMPDQVVWFGILNLIGCAYLLMIPLEKVLKRIPPCIGIASSFLCFFLFQHLDDGYLGIGNYVFLPVPPAFYEKKLFTILGMPFPGFYSSDYFPVFPWFFLFAAGHFFSLWLNTKPELRRSFSYSLPILSKIGQNSLLVYLFHQPVCMILCYLMREEFMEITEKMFLIICPFLFLAGLVDAIGGGGGLISLPAYLIAGLPPHAAIATNKMSSTCGTTLATLRFIKNKLVNFKLAVPSVIAAILGSSIGAHVSMSVSEKIMMYVFVFILPIAAFFVLNKKLFHDHGSDEIILDKRTYLTAGIAAFVIGFYDGFYGPGTGTFLIIAFTVFAKLSVKTANAQAKVINLTTNITSLIIFLINGQVVLVIGIAAALCNMAGGYLGAGLVMKNGAKIVKPSILLVLFLLLLKVIGII